MSFYFRRITFLFGLILAFQHSFSQAQQIGTWKVYLPYGSSLGACDAGDKVYDAASKSIFSYEKSTGVIQTYDQSSGLSDIGITATWILFKMALMFIIYLTLKTRLLRAL
jgi:hypothetical protein